jgi:hypothetical protein
LGEAGNDLTTPLLKLHIPSSRLKGFGQGLGSAAPEGGYSWYAGI